MITSFCCLREQVCTIAHRASSSDPSGIELIGMDCFIQTLAMAARHFPGALCFDRVDLFFFWLWGGGGGGPPRRRIASRPERQVINQMGETLAQGGNAASSV